MPVRHAEARTQDAVGELKLAVDSGFRDGAALVRDKDLASLHRNPEFLAIAELVRNGK